jgi:2-polyprenyl-3-methyl-5-hydroxy-6-metoxy-1,4-benzoquinol methylase
VIGPRDMDEQARLEAIAGDSWYADGLNAGSIRYRADLLAPRATGRTCLELGPAEGIFTQALADRFGDRLTLVDGSAAFCDALRQRFAEARVIHALFEELDPDDRFDTVVLGHVLEHVKDPVALLRRARGWLAPDGVLIATVPNARSLHRQAAVLMGLLPDEHALGETDRHHGHRRVYDPDTFRSDLEQAGLHSIEVGGYWIKPLPNAELEASWTEEQLGAFMRLGERYPDIAAELYAVARR